MGEEARDIKMDQGRGMEGGKEKQKREEERKKQLRDPRREHEAKSGQGRAGDGSEGAVGLADHSRGVLRGWGPDIKEEGIGDGEGRGPSEPREDYRAGSRSQEREKGSEETRKEAGEAMRSEREEGRGRRGRGWSGVRGPQRGEDKEEGARRVRPARVVMGARHRGEWGVGRNLRDRRGGRQ